MQQQPPTRARRVLQPLVQHVARGGYGEGEEEEDEEESLRRVL